MCSRLYAQANPVPEEGGLSSLCFSSAGLSIPLWSPEERRSESVCVYPHWAQHFALVPEKSTSSELSIFFGIGGQATRGSLRWDRRPAPQPRSASSSVPEERRSELVCELLKCALGSASCTSAEISIFLGTRGEADRVSVRALRPSSESLCGARGKRTRNCVQASSLADSASPSGTRGEGTQNCVRARSLAGSASSCGTQREGSPNSVYVRYSWSAHHLPVGAS
ncbi:hypothetical protein NDU88_004377 [Pleurodeles waltl]|uniref:Uncharacterized protein n=1 Tax=Pleurodeles waltl TaxID=8319 RepID=A0AAV7SIP6_PLEWA|nr:hypothetical protein NDU88_004377 [Pleurodeles waltl]